MKFMFHIEGLGHQVWRSGGTRSLARKPLWTGLSDAQRDAVVAIECIDEEAESDAGPQTYIVLQEKEFAQRHPASGFYLRWRGVGGEVGCEPLDGECTLAGAMRLAHAKGFQPTHWYDSDTRSMIELPVLSGDSLR